MAFYIYGGEGGGGGGGGGGRGHYLLKIKIQKSMKQVTKSILYEKVSGI